MRSVAFIGICLPRIAAAGLGTLGDVWTLVMMTIYTQGFRTVY